MPFKEPTSPMQPEKEKEILSKEEKIKFIEDMAERRRGEIGLAREIVQKGAEKVIDERREELDDETFNKFIKGPLTDAIELMQDFRHYIAERGK